MAAFVYDYHVDSTYSVPYVVSYQNYDSTDTYVDKPIYVAGIRFYDVNQAWDYVNQIRERALRQPLIARRLPWKCYPPRCYVARCYNGRQKAKNKARFYKQKVRA